MTKPIVKSIITPAIVAGIWIPNIKELFSFPEPVYILLVGVLLLGFAKVCKNKFRNN